jgi:hypothetical protein
LLLDTEVDIVGIKAYNVNQDVSGIGKGGFIGSEFDYIYGSHSLEKKQIKRLVTLSTHDQKGSCEHITSS